MRVSSDRLANAAAPVLMLWAPFLNFSQYHELPLWSAEVLLCLAALALAALAVGGLMALRPDSLRPLGYGFLLLVFADLQFRSGAKTELFVGLLGQAVDAATILLTVSGLLVVFLGAYLLRRHLGRIFAAGFAAVVAATFLVPGGTARVSERTLAPTTVRQAMLPPVVHIILDEHIGIAGIPTDLPGGIELKRDLEAFYAKYGFALFPRAYSVYANTFDSVPNLMNGTAERTPDANLAWNATGSMFVKQNRWFSLLQARGYRVRVSQTNAIDFCVDQPAVESCHVYQAETVRALLGTPLAASQRAREIMLSFLDGAVIYRSARVAYDMTQDQAEESGPSPARRNLLDVAAMGALLALPSFDRMRAEIPSTPGGTAWVAHILVPHRTFLLGRDCTVVADPSAWGLGYGGFRPWQEFNTASTRAQSYGAYFEQIRCATKKLGEIFTAMQQAGIFDQATIIVHGDHGSRIGLRKARDASADRLTERDMIDAYSALFALRMPGLAPGLRPEQRSIHALFAEHVLAQPLTEETRNVFLDMENRQTGRPFPSVPMPALVP